VVSGPRPKTTLALAALVLVLPASTAAAERPHGSASTRSAAALTFGRKGGNIAPYSVTIARDGHASATGSAQPAATVSLDALAGLLTLARAERFFAMPHVVACQGALPDFASFYITITTPGGTRSVTVHGGCNAAFTQLYAVVSAVGGV